MLKSYKTEIKPTPEQAARIRQTIGVCRFVYNLYIAHNMEFLKNGQGMMSAYSFSVWLNNEYQAANPDKSWIKEASSKAVKQSLLNGEAAMRRFLKKQAKAPRFKKKGRSNVKMHFVKTDAKAVIRCERHRIKIPTIGWVRLKEKGYVPVTKSGKVIKSGAVSLEAGRYYVSVLVEEPDCEKQILNPDGIGVDLGIKDFAVVSDGTVYKNINKTRNMRMLERRLRREQRRLSRKYESLKKSNKDKTNIKKGGAARQNIQKQILKVQKLHRRISNVRNDYTNKCVNGMAKTKPSYISIEDLNVSGMMKNRHLSKAVASQGFYSFRRKLEARCKRDGIELRIVDRFYPSSKMCHNCGRIKHDLKLSDRTYICECGYRCDRDLNASLNLRDAKAYKTA